MNRKRLTQKELDSVQKIYTKLIPEDFIGIFPIYSYRIDDSTEIIVGEKRRYDVNCILQDVFHFKRKNIYIYSVTHTTRENNNR